MEDIEAKFNKRNPTIIFVGLGCSQGSVVGAMIGANNPETSVLAFAAVVAGGVIGLMVGRLFSAKFNESLD